MNLVMIYTIILNMVGHLQKHELARRVLTFPVDMQHE